MAKIRTFNGTEMHIVKTDIMSNKRIRLSLTRKTLKDGQNKYGVVLRDRKAKKHTTIKSFNTISEAFNLYKKLAAAMM